MSITEHWTQQEDELLLSLRAKKIIWPIIAEQIPGRTKWACKNRHAFLKMGPCRLHLQKERRNLRLRQQYLHKRLQDFTAFVIPESVLAERDARINAPRSLSALLLGDPPLGWSMLDRRASA